MTPAAPASTDAMKNVNVITRSVSMPIIDRGLAVEGDGAHRLPQPRAGHDQRERDHQRDRWCVTTSSWTTVTGRPIDVEGGMDERSQVRRCSDFRLAGKRRSCSAGRA